MILVEGKQRLTSQMKRELQHAPGPNGQDDVNQNWVLPSVKYANSV